MHINYSIYDDNDNYIGTKGHLSAAICVAENIDCHGCHIRVYVENGDQYSLINIINNFELYK